MVVGGILAGFLGEGVHIEAGTVVRNVDEDVVLLAGIDMDMQSGIHVVELQAVENGVFDEGLEQHLHHQAPAQTRLDVHLVLQRHLKAVLLNGDVVVHLLKLPIQRDIHGLGVGQHIF